METLEARHVCATFYVVRQSLPPTHLPRQVCLGPQLPPAGLSAAATPSVFAVSLNQCCRLTVSARTLLLPPSPPPSFLPPSVPSPLPSLYRSAIRPQTYAPHNANVDKAAGGVGTGGGAAAGSAAAAAAPVAGGEFPDEFSFLPQPPVGAVTHLV